MTKLVLSLTLIALTAACASPTSPVVRYAPPTATLPSDTEPPVLPTDVARPPESQSGLAETAAKAELATALGLPADEIKVVSLEAVEWPDSCLGISYPNARCLAVITPGYRIMLAAQGIEYEYHTNRDGSQVASAAPALTWRREGGFAGFCDDLTVSITGEAIASSCKSGELYPPGKLTDEESAQLRRWAEAFASVVIEQKDPAVADAMTVILTMTGSGSGQPSAVEQQAMLLWAQGVYDRLKP